MQLGVQAGLGVSSPTNGMGTIAVKALTGDFASEAETFNRYRKRSVRLDAIRT